MREIKEVKNVLKPFGCLDVLYYYSIVSNCLSEFLKGKEIATKTLLSGGMPFFLKRGSNTEPLFVNDMECVSGDMLRLRAEYGLGEAREKLTKKQQLVWEYFVPRKLIHFFYATNNEHPGNQIERIFIDIDKGKSIKNDVARVVASSLVDAIKNDNKFNILGQYKLKVLWTGNSFHIYLILKNSVGIDFYNEYFAYSKNDKLGSFIGRWAEDVKNTTGISVEGGHEKREENIVIDPSGTPSGKLARAPFSLHLKDANEIDGIAVPISQNDLNDKTLIKRLKMLEPRDILRNINDYAKLLK